MKKIECPQGDYTIEVPDDSPITDIEHKEVDGQIGHIHVRPEADDQTPDGG